MSWSHYMRTEGWRDYGYAEINEITADHTNKAVMQEQIDKCATADEMWKLITVWKMEAHEKAAGRKYGVSK